MRYAGHLSAAGRGVAAGGSGAAGVLQANPVIPLFQTVRLRSRAALESVRKHFGLPTLPFAGPPQPARSDAETVGIPHVAEPAGGGAGRFMGRGGLLFGFR